MAIYALTFYIDRVKKRNYITVLALLAHVKEVSMSVKESHPDLGNKGKEICSGFIGGSNSIKPEQSLAGLRV